MTDYAKIYDKFSPLGLRLAPRKSGKKYPIFGYWGKNATPDFSREVVLRHVEREQSGFNVLTGNGIFVVDIDPNSLDTPFETVLATIQTLSPSKFMVKTASGGLHLYYRLPDGVKYKNSTSKGVDVRCDGGTAVFIGSSYTYAGEEATKKGLPDPYTGTYAEHPNGEYDEIPLISQELLDWLEVDKASDIRLTAEAIKKHTAHQSAEMSRRVKDHFVASPDARERVVLECLAFALAKWDKKKTYDEWLALWISAHHGAPTEKVRDFIVNHPNVYWADGLEGKRDFIHKFASHEYREGQIYTVATLFWLARRSGWLAETEFKIAPERVNEFGTRYITDWLQTAVTVPKKALIWAQTGAGKTRALIWLWNYAKRPKTVVFVPTIKLALELASTLTRNGMPATSYYDPTTRKPIEAEAMLAANVLVTTLQSFVSRLRSVGVSMDGYGIVYIEECDQLLSQFARGGGGRYSSHVRDDEAREGFDTIREALKMTPYVWGVDATMTALSVKAFDALDPTNPVTVYKNVQTTQKAPVVLVDDKMEAYTVISQSLEENKRVVVVCDTAREAETVYTVMTSIGVVSARRALLVTRATERIPAVSAFMLDVNGEAEKYRLVCYNSVMGSGVSVDQVRADVVVQFSTYLTPRDNLQLLNRYRQQTQVYCYYRATENLYAGTADEVLQLYKETLEQEARLLGVPTLERDEIATIRSVLSAMSVGDEAMQNRSPRLFYTSLLKADGRAVVGGSDMDVDTSLQSTLEGVREIKKAKRAYIRENWQSVRPITPENPADEVMTDLEVACGEAHAEILRVLADSVPADADPAYIFDVVAMFASKSYYLSSFARKRVAVERAETLVADQSHAASTISPIVTTIVLLADAGIVLQNIEAYVDETKLEQFALAVAAKQTLYDSLFGTRDKYDALADRATDKTALGMALLKRLLGLIGLKLRRDRSRREPCYRIENLQQAIDFLEWRYGADQALTFEIEDAILSIDDIDDLEPSQRESVIALWKDGVKFSTAVGIVQRGEQWA